MTATRSWRTAYASVIGTSHHRSGTPCQDAGLCRTVGAADGSEVLVAAVSDGAGTAARSEAGSALAVASFVEAFGDAVEAATDLDGIDREFALGWLESARKAIRELARSEGRETRDYACTILGAVVGPASSVFLQVGDGAIVVAERGTDDFSWVFWPQHGEFANQTYFIVQDDVDQVFKFEVGTNRIDEVALFSDGIERLVLDIANKAVHTPSFRPIFKWLAGTEPTGTAEPSAALTAYLGSAHINARTDDDKTLVMATRATPSAGPA